MKNLIKVGMALWLCLGGIIPAIAQDNLVLNPSFEEFVVSEQTVSLPYPFDYVNPNYVPTNWSQYASCDFYIESANEPPNRARTGTNFVRFAAYSSNSNVYREFPTGITSAALIAGELYEVEFWAKNAETNAAAAQSVGLQQFPLGAYLSTSPVPCDYPADCVFNYIPAFEDFMSPYTNGWHRISGFFVPETTGVHHITVGNFINSSNSGFDGNVSTLIYVDDVSVVGCTNTEGLIPQPVIAMQENACIYSQITADLSASVDVQAYRYQLCDEGGNALGSFSPWVVETPGEIDVAQLGIGNFQEGQCYQLKVQAQASCDIVETSATVCIDSDDFELQEVNSPVCEGEGVSLSADHHDDWTYYWGTPNDLGLYGSGLGMSSITVPADLEVTIYQVTIETAGGCESSLISNEIVVHPLNNTPPTTNGINNSNSFTTYIQANHNACFNIFTSDNAEEGVLISASNLPAGATFSDDNGFQETGTFCWTPGEEDIGFHSFEVLLEDQNLCGSEQSTYTITLKVLCSYCPAEIYYENRQPAPDGIPLPMETVAGYKIVAGEDVDDSQINGPVLTGDAEVTFRAPEIILLEPGFTGGVNFTAIIDPSSCIDECEDCCDDWGGFTHDPIPNVFTPNGDGINDFWYVPDVNHPFCAYGAQEYELTIFNRWGTPIYTVEDVNGSSTCCPFEAPAPENNIPHASIYWDGLTNNDNPSNDGVYFYIFTLRSCGQSVTVSGDITLFGSSGLVGQSELPQDQAQYRSNGEELDDKTKKVLENEMAEFVPPLVYPNPFSDQLQVSWGSDPSSVEVYSMEGKLIFRKASQDYTELLDLSNFPSGSYLLKLFSEGQTFEQVIIKE